MSKSLVNNSLCFYELYLYFYSLFFSLFLISYQTPHSVYFGDLPLRNLRLFIGYFECPNPD